MYLNHQEEHIFQKQYFYTMNNNIQQLNHKKEPEFQRHYTQTRGNNIKRDMDPPQTATSYSSVHPRPSDSSKWSSCCASWWRWCVTDRGHVLSGPLSQSPQAASWVPSHCAIPGNKKQQCLSHFAKYWFSFIWLKSDPWSVPCFFLLSLHDDLKKLLLRSTPGEQWFKNIHELF